MKLKSIAWAFLGLLLGLDSHLLSAQETASDQPKAIPQSRAEFLKALDDLKHREARLPLGAASADTAAPTGTLGVVNNGRMRQLYLPEEFRPTSVRTPDPAMTLPNDFGVELFWIASRVNNCHYCLGHQEVKLKKEGLTEEMLLWLDTDWQKFNPRSQAGFEFARVLTHSPNRITDAQITELHQHFSPLEILEMAFLVGRYNATNRWTDSLGIPQEMDRDFSTHLSHSDLEKPSTVIRGPNLRRPLPRDFETWQQQLAVAKQRQSRLPLLTAAQSGGAKLEPHEALLLNFPIAGKQWLEQWATAASTSYLPNHLASRVLFVCAMEDGAAYVQHLACRQLAAEGLDAEAAFALLSDDSDSPQGSALRFARKLTSTPQAMTDGDIALLQQHFSPQQIAEIIYRVGLAAHLDRVTETAGLGWE